MRRGRCRLPLALIPILLVGLALAGFLLSAASLPHRHDPAQPGLYNQEHDLSYLATFAGNGLVPDTPAAAPLIVLIVFVAAAIAGAMPPVWRRHADFRAPPLR